MGPGRQSIWRASCNAVEARLSIIRDEGAVLRIKRPGLPETRIEIDPADVGSTVAEFQGIGEDPEKFAVFINARA
jgi:hypothetical protein